MSKFTVIRSEEEVGILKRISSIPRFKGIFKGRFSDFHVNEIDLDGKIVELTTLDPPEERTRSDINDDDAEICSWIPESIRNDLKKLQEKLENAKKNNVVKWDPVWKEKVEIPVTSLAKDQRTKIHKWLGNNNQLSSETVERSDEKYIVAVYDNKQKRNRRRPDNRPKYTHCTLYKEGVDTSDAIGQIAKKLWVKPNYITFCGTKDKHGKTTQRICVQNVDANKIAKVSRELRSIYIGNYEYLPKHLKLGDLKGNHFKILLRDVQCESDDCIISSVESLKTKGFINYFGLQRFGSYETSTHAVGKSILQNNWIEAFNLLLKPKNNDSDFMKEAKYEWFSNRDPKAAISKFPHWHRSIESSLLHGLAKYFEKKDFIGVFLRIPRNVRHLYVHSFQSYLWNQVASFRIEKMGLEPVVGDIVYVDEDKADKGLEDSFLLDDVNLEATEEEESSFNSNLKNPSRDCIKVKVLKEDDLPNYSIFDVLIPIQGSQIIIPEDSHIRSFYDELLKKEGLEQDCFLKFKPVSDQPKGAYRKLVVRPRNTSHKIIPYSDTDKLDNFIPSELDRLKEQKNERNSTTSNKEMKEDEINADDDDNATLQNSEENKNGKSEKTKESSCAEKNKKCVIVEFSLPSSSYATMALREILESNSNPNSNTEVNSQTTASSQAESQNDESSSPKEKKIEESESEPNAKRMKLE